MSEAMKGSVRKELRSTNVGIMLMFDESQARTSASIYLQWCIAKPFTDYIKEKRLQNVMLFVQIFDEQKREHRHLFDLASTQEIVQFYTTGTHTIHATVVWGTRLKTIRAYLLDKGKNGAYKYQLAGLLGGRRDGIGLKRFGDAHLPVEVPTDFFAPVMSARQEAWVNLWFETKAWNSCQIRRRKMLAYTLQPLTILVWGIFRGIGASAWAFFMGVLCAQRVDLYPIFHPVRGYLSDIYREDYTSWLTRDAHGELYRFGKFSWMLAPGWHVVILIIATILMWEQLSWWNLFVGYFLVVLAGVMGAVVIATVFGSVGLTAMGIGKAFSRWKQYRDYRKFDDLLCTNSPPVGLRSVGYTPRLIYQRLKYAVCKPVALS